MAIISLTGIRHCSRDACEARRGAGGDGGPPSNSGTRALFIFRGAGLCNRVEDAVRTGSGEKKEKKKINLARSIAVHQAANAPIV